MFNFPFFRLPFGNFYYPYSYYSNYYNKNKSDLLKSDKLNIDYQYDKQKNNAYKNNIYKQRKSSKYNSSPFDFISGFLNGDISYNNPVLEIFGIELYLDDIIILGLLFILYKEGVKDDMLFLTLILLLLT